MGEVHHAGAGQEPLPHPEGGLPPHRPANPLETDDVICLDLLKLSAPRGTRADDQAGEKAGHGIRTDDREDVLDRTARTGRSPDDDIAGNDPPLLHEVRAEGKYDLPGRDLAREGFEDEVVLRTEDIPAGVAGLALEPGGGKIRRIEDAVQKILLSLPDQGNERLAGRGAAGTAVLPGRLPCHGLVPR